MMWKARGAIEETGKDVTLTVEGRTEQEARQSPNLKGVLVSSITPVGWPRSSAGIVLGGIANGIAMLLMSIAGVAGIALIATGLGDPKAGGSYICAGILCFILIGVVSIVRKLPPRK